MGHDKLRKFAENETFACLLQPSAQELLADGYFHLRDHAVKGRWSAFFAGLPSGSSPLETSFGPHRCASLAVPPLNVPRVAVFPGRTAGPASSQPAIPEEVRAVQTFYERLFLEQGYPITYLSFVIDHDGPYVSPRDPDDFDAEAWRAAEGPRLLFGHDSAETRRQKLKNR